jgi:hypothetical protein
MRLDISEDWQPSAANINALPPPLRRYIHALETRFNPAGDVRVIENLIQQVAELQKLLADERRRKDRDSAASTPGRCQRRFSA